MDKRLYDTLEKAIADSNFWQQGNTEDDGDYEDIPGLSTSLLKLFKSFSVNLPSRKLRA